MKNVYCKNIRAVLYWSHYLKWRTAMQLTEQLKREMGVPPAGRMAPHYFRAMGYRDGKHTSPSGRRADGIAALLTKPTPHIFQNDLIVGCIRPLFVEITDAQWNDAAAIVAAYPERHFGTNSDHYSPDYQTPLAIGIVGMLEQIDRSALTHAADPDRLAYLESMRLTLLALRDRLLAYAQRAAALVGSEGYDDARLESIRQNCTQLASGAPETFAQALQLVWMIHTCFLYEGRYAMALGRIDQYLYPFYLRDCQNGILDAARATELIENALVKICERKFYPGGDDVVNIAIGGVDEQGRCAVNDLTYCTLQAVRNINLPGPNLSARVTPDCPDRFLDECLKVIGTGLGYPALMNDTVNMAALSRYGYDIKDIRNYTMVGCIENFITGMQPPWSDGRFDAPRFLEYVLGGGRGLLGEHRGLDTGAVEDITSMDDLMKKLEKQIAHGVAEYVRGFHAANEVEHPEQFTQPFLSCFCRDCIGRGLDINMGGAVYPSVHGVGLMGVGTLSDSLAAIEKVVFVDRAATLSEVADAVKKNFEGCEALHRRLLAAPKYGNDDDFVDKYAVWYTSYISDCFDCYKTRDGGGIYTAMAANISNIYAGMGLGASPDGRLSGQPLSDAASPTYGRDTRGITSTLLSVSKPDYTRCACGTVVNQKLSPSVFADGSRQKLLQAIRVYFARGGQELQINATSREVLRDAMEHPENYRNLVVRVSGFSATYIHLAREVQQDILARTQHQ